MRHLTGINDLSDRDIAHILNLADSYAKKLKKKNFKSRLLDGKTIINLFFETSTRTRTSFEMAVLRLGASVINWDPDTSALKKGETFSDTLLTLNALSPDAAIIRHSEYNAPHFATQIMSCPVINAGDSWREHPTQALLDALTLRQRFGRIEGLTVAICGDVSHSRVAGSNILLLTRMSASVRVIAPEFLMPQKFPVNDIAKFTSMEDGLLGCDVIMMLRNQKERMNSDLIPDDATFFRKHGLTSERLALANKNAVVMHPGPMNRGVEIADDVADDPRYSLILAQVANGVPLRMAVLDWALRG